jgi:hypothetical protein
MFAKNAEKPYADGATSQDTSENVHRISHRQISGNK